MTATELVELTKEFTEKVTQDAKDVDYVMMIGINDTEDTGKDTAFGVTATNGAGDFIFVAGASLFDRVEDDLRRELLSLYGEDKLMEELKNNTDRPQA